jgi:hypothetical protein
MRIRVKLSSSETEEKGKKIKKERGSLRMQQAKKCDQ